MVGDDVDGGAERTERYDFDLDFVSFLEGRLVEACIALGALFVVVVVGEFSCLDRVEKLVIPWPWLGNRSRDVDESN